MDNVLSGNRLSTAHQNIARGKFTHDFTPKVAAKLWKGLTVILNSCFGGPTKGWKEWRKTWQDIKASAKVKFGPLVRLQEGEADPSFQYTLNDFQKRVLAILRMNLTSGQGETTDPVLLFNGMVPVSNSPTYLSEYPTHPPPLLECASDDYRKSSSLKYLRLNKTSKAVNIFAKSQNTSLELCKRELQLRRQRFMFERRRHKEEMMFRRESEDARLALKRRSLDIYQELARSALQVGSQLVGAFDRLAKSLENTRVDNPSKVQ
uniref:Regulatory protein zeste n=1 Tax=Timema californicum TaxID=61474 RepID=A0A7R9J898_TIMCA|nr:unnamed protein product [Timema californicum]